MRVQLVTADPAADGAPRRKLSNMIQSMTGFASASADTPQGRLVLELRSVNSRFLDLQLRVSEELRAVEPDLRELLSARLSRGKVECRLSLHEGGALQAPRRLDAEALARLAELAGQARQAIPDAAPLRVADILRWPGIVAEAEATGEALRDAVRELCARAIAELTAVRSREGEKLGALILERIAAMRAHAEAVAPLVPQSVAAYQAKLAERLREAMGALNVPGADERIRAEVALFATRVDVAEELERLRAHCTEVERVIRAGGAAGKRLDFLAQELNREANTLASKAATGQIADRAMELKLLVEQIREQAQNIE